MLGVKTAFETASDNQCSARLRVSFFRCHSVLGIESLQESCMYVQGVS